MRAAAAVRAPDATRVAVRLATGADEPALRGLLKRLVVPGDIRVTFEREPDFFGACAVHGDTHVIVSVDRTSGAVVGLGARSIAPAYVNGAPCDVGYLSDLRLEPSYRNRTLVARGYRLLRELHRDGRASLYTSVIFATNQVALEMVATPRAGLPRYHDLGVVHCPGIHVERRMEPIAADADVRRATPAMLRDVIACLNRNNMRRQFAPVHRECDFAAGGRWKDFPIEHCHVAVRGARIVGVIGVWDQRAFKQTRIVDYASHLGAGRPLANLWRRWSGAPAYPRPGDYLRYACVSFAAADEDDARVMRALLRAAYNDQVGSDRLYLMMAAHVRDPWLPILEAYRHTPFEARLFCVTFDDAGAPALDGRAPHVEAALL